MSEYTIYACDVGRSGCLGESTDETALTVAPVRFESGKWKRPISGRVHVCGPCGGESVRLTLKQYQAFLARAPGLGDGIIALADPHGGCVLVEELVEGQDWNVKRTREAVETVSEAIQ